MTNKIERKEEVPEHLKELFKDTKSMCFGCGFEHDENYADCVWNKEI